MKKTFLAKRNALLSSANVSWGVLALAFAVLALFVRLLAPNFFLYALTPAFRAADILAAKNHAFLSSFQDAAALAARNERLMDENTALANENRALAEKIMSFDEIVGAQDSKKNLDSGILAGVVARPPESPYDTLILAAGAGAGVALGYGAFAVGGVPIGAVSTLTADFSRVTLFSSPGVVTRGWVGRERAPIDIRGAGAGAMRASLSRSAGIALGDTVFAPGPGSVVRIDGAPSAPEVTLHIRPAANPFSIAWVELRDVGAALSDAFFTATSTDPS